jgi:hypothetical protein
MVLWTITALGVLGGCSPAGGPGTNAEASEVLGSSDLRIESVSTRPYLVTGGDVLLRIEAGEDLDLSQVRVSANGMDVTARFSLDVPGASKGASLIGFVEGLALGDNQIEARIPDSEATAVLEITNYPITGPIISGPHEMPFFCGTERFRTAGGETLGAPLDENCSVETRVEYVYLSTEDDGGFKAYGTPPGGAMPPDMAEATTLDGEVVPFIVRVQTGTVNRAIYQSAMLHDPADPTPDPWTRSRGWNGKLVYTHGGGCRNGWFQQGRSTGQVLNVGLLGMGYAVTSASLNVFGTNCNDLLASETHIMVKERFVESYGQPTYSIATGGSGGSYQSHQTADNYPGVFDGIIVSSSFPDVTSATIFTLTDSRLLSFYFTEIGPRVFTQEEQRLVSGFGSWGSIPNMSRGAARVDPTYSVTASAEEQGAEVGRLPELEALRYSLSNPDGIRATVYDHTVNVYGIDPATGFAARPLDNYGVQYGLDVLNRGQITKAQFLSLNRDVGGYDADLNHVPERHRADPTAARRALDTGRILYGGAGLATTPVIDYRSYTDDREGGDIHMIVHQFSTRARMEAANGHADNHVMNVGGRWGYTEDRPDLGVLFRQMDRWLTNIQADDGPTPQSEKVVRAKPAGLADNCWDTRGGGQREGGQVGAGGRVNVMEPLTYEGAGTCGEIYPAYPTPRHVAGGPLANNIVSCHLKPLDRDDYEVEFTSQEWSALEAIFPDGVCDWAQGDLHTEGYQGTWLSFGPSEVNRAR